MLFLLRIYIVFFVAAIRCESSSSSYGDGDLGACRHYYNTYYDVLGVHQAATTRQLRKAYHAKALLLHPDKQPDGGGDRDAAFIELQEAYQVLKHPTRRKGYDAALLAKCTRTTTTTATGNWNFDGQNWEFRAAPGESIDLAEAMRELRRHQERLAQQRQERLIMFSTPSKVKRLTPEHFVIHHNDNVAHLILSHTNTSWLILACTERRKNCRKHETVFDALSDRIRRTAVRGVRIGFLDCGQRVVAPPSSSSICSLVHIHKVSLLCIKEGNGGKKQRTIQINNQAPLQINSLYDYAIHMASK